MEVFIAELRELARDAKINSDVILKWDFISGMLEEMAKDLKSMNKVEECGLVELILKAKSLVNINNSGNNGRRYFRTGAFYTNNLQKCFSCGGPQLLKICWKLNIKCFWCGKRGHIQKNCILGDEEVEAIAQEMPP